MKVIYICLNPNCGERIEGTDKTVIKFCPRCKTKKGQEEMEKENEEIKNEKNKTK